MDSITFVQVDQEKAWIKQFNDIYEEYNIYRTIIVVDDNSTLEAIRMYLDGDGHSYDTISMDTTVDYKEEFEKFLTSCKRILIISYEDYMLGFNYVTESLVNQHNLLILENLDSFQEKTILNMLRTKIQTGFMKLFLPYYIWVN